MVSMVSFVIGPKGKDKLLVKPLAKYKLESNKDTNVEEFTPVKYKRNFITALELTQPASYFCSPVRPTYFCQLPSNVLVVSSSPVFKIANY